jgi:predicted cobalt transporter CbtA
VPSDRAHDRPREPRRGLEGVVRGKDAVELVREQDARETARRDYEERRGYLVGGLVCLAVGVALAVMIASFAAKGAGAWTVGLIPGLIGLVLVGFGVFMGPRR